MKQDFRSLIRNFLSCSAEPSTSNHPVDVDVQEEYANAFRTQSYVEFWTRVLNLTNGESTSRLPMESTTADRLPSYRLFAEHLLDPDQPTISNILASTGKPNNYFPLLSDYFTQTADAFFLCSRLLRDIDRTRVRHRTLKITLQSLENIELTFDSQPQPMVAHLVEFTHFLNPFLPSTSSSSRLLAVQDGCSNLLKRLELGREEVRAKLRRVHSFKCGSAVLLVALTASLAVIILAHGLALLVATPGLIVASVELASSRRLTKVTAQLDAAAKGTYTLNRDLDTISRLVVRLGHELEHMRAMVKYWIERREDRLQATGEVARQLKKNHSSFADQLDELEEHLFLCFMTINRARNLAVKEILNPKKGSNKPAK